jgi:amino acid transporter
MTTTAGGPADGAPPGHLERNHLPLWKVAVLALAYVQIGPVTALSASGVMPFSGSGTWLAVLLSATTMVLVAIVVGAFARRLVVTGSLVSYAQEAFGSRGRSLVAASLTLGYVALAAAMVGTVLVFSSSALLDFGYDGAVGLAAQSAAAITISTLAAACAWRGIDVSVRVVVVLGSVCIPFVLYTMTGSFLATHADWHAQLGVPGASATQIVQGAIAATGYYVGFDGIAALAAETRDPTRNIPRVLIGTMAFFGAATTLSCLIQYPVLASHAADLDAGSSSVAIFAQAMSVPRLAVVVDVLIVPASLAGTVALYNLGARVVATTAADGLLPRWLSRIHPRFHTPHAAVAALGIVGAGAPIALQALLHASPLLSSVYIANLATYYWILPYLVTCAGILVVMRREGRYEPLVAVAACTSFVAIGYAAVELFRSPADAASTVLPYIALGSVAAVALWLAFQKPPADADSTIEQVL